MKARPGTENRQRDDQSVITNHLFPIGTDPSSKGNRRLAMTIDAHKENHEMNDVSQVNDAPEALSFKDENQRRYDIRPPVKAAFLMNGNLEKTAGITIENVPNANPRLVVRLRKGDATVLVKFDFFAEANTVEGEFGDPDEILRAIKGHLGRRIYDGDRLVQTPIWENEDRIFQQERRENVQATIVPIDILSALDGRLETRGIRTYESDNLVWLEYGSDTVVA